jgi:acyl-CoA reductase-like NAD-dependent aldehyde dehydrogenase
MPSWAAIPVAACSPPLATGQLSLVLKEPYGVVGCIVPWNYPILLHADHAQGDLWPDDPHHGLYQL